MSSNTNDSAPLPPWGVVIRALVDALRKHRADMHTTSDRPCSTCSQSAAALDLYERKVAHGK